MFGIKISSKTLKLVLQMLLLTLQMVSMLRIGVHAFRHMCPTKQIYTKHISTVNAQVQVVLNQSLYLIIFFAI